MRRIAIAAAALLFGTAGVAVATTVVQSIVDEEGIIHACRGKHTGILRAVPADASCFSWEEPLSWSQQGPPGDPGEAGSAVAFATVRFDGTLNRERTSPNVAHENVVQPGKGTGVYCFVGLPFAPRSILATATEPVLTVNATLLPRDATANPQSPIVCKDGWDAEVRVTSFGSPVDGGFTVWFED